MQVHVNRKFTGPYPPPYGAAASYLLMKEIITLNSDHEMLDLIGCEVILGQPMKTQI